MPVVRRVRHTLVLLFVAMTSIPMPGPRAAVADDTPGALQQRMADIYSATRDRDIRTSEALIGALRLPAHAAWFRQTFGEPAAARLTAEYEALLQRFEADAAKLFAGVVQKGQSEIRVLRFTDLDDRNAVGNQRDAMAAMTTRAPLYSVRFVQPGERLGMHLYSFVHAGGGFRFVGRLTAAKP